MNYLDYTFVVDRNNTPCMPITNNEAGFLIRCGVAKPINYDPFVVQRLDDYVSESEVRDEITMKMDMGYMNIGFSVGTEDHEYLSGQVKLLSGISDRLEQRASYRRTRRGRIRYRRNKNVDYKTVHNPTYKNGNEDNWVAPSTQHKIDSHIRLYRKIASWIPVDKAIIEIANFDIQAIKALKDGKEISGVDYQRGEMYGFENVKQYVRERDKYTCQICKADTIKKGTGLEVHHIIPRSQGGSNKPSNLISLCKKCHNKVHSNSNDNKYFRELQKRKINDTYKDATFMNTSRWRIYESIGSECPTYISYGYITSLNRKTNNLPKFHYVDAACIKKFTYKTLTRNIYLVEQKRCNDRCMSTFWDAKYIDSRDGKEKKGSELSYKRLPNATSKRTTRKEDVENDRVYRQRKTKKGEFRFVCNSRCLKPGDLIRINVGKRSGVIGEIATSKMENNRYKVIFCYDGQDVKYPSISISMEEYKELKETGSCESVSIVRTRRGMIWRRYDREKYEAEHEDQYAS